ncbi:MAG: Ribose ABC transport system, permease protein RbsC, partial [uncultured Thermomicrobiales bacterium]
ERRGCDCWRGALGLRATAVAGHGLADVRAAAEPDLAQPRPMGVGAGIHVRQQLAQHCPPGVAGRDPRDGDDLRHPDRRRRPLGRLDRRPQLRRRRHPDDRARLVDVAGGSGDGAGRGGLRSGQRADRHPRRHPALHRHPRHDADLPGGGTPAHRRQADLRPDRRPAPVRPLGHPRAVRGAVAGDHHRHRLPGGLPGPSLHQTRALHLRHRRQRAGDPVLRRPHRPLQAGRLFPDGARRGDRRSDVELAPQLDPADGRRRRGAERDRRCRHRRHLALRRGRHGRRHPDRCRPDGGHPERAEPAPHLRLLPADRDRRGHHPGRVDRPPPPAGVV